MKLEDTEIGIEKWVRKYLKELHTEWCNIYLKGMVIHNDEIPEQFVRMLKDFVIQKQEQGYFIGRTQPDDK